MTKQSKFEENYFFNYYKKISGKFSYNDLDKNRRWYKSWIDILDRYVPIKNGKGKAGLEIGCGIAAPTSILVDYGYKMYATDLSRLAVKRASLLQPEINFSVWDVEKMSKFPFNKKFDLVVGFEVIEHLNDPQKAISNFRKILKKGGILVLSTPFPYKKSFNDPTHINVRHPQEWIKILEKFGYRDIKTQEASFIPFFYKFISLLSFGVPFNTRFPLVNSTVFVLAKK